MAYAAIGETRRSLQDFDLAIRIDPGFAKAFVHRGNIHQGTQQYDLALADYNAEVELDPKDAYSLYSRGLTKRALNHWLRQALPNFEASLAYEMLNFLGPDAAEGLAALREKRSPAFGPSD